MEKHFIAWWNVENLFDEKDAPPDRRPDDVKRKIIADLSDWTPAVLDRKLQNLAGIITQMNSGLGPDILGVCEVENRYVLELLTGKLNLPQRRYGIIHANLSDNRGIDVAFIYDQARYTFNPNEFFQHTIVKRYATREIIQATLVTAKGNELILLGNHWPSRSAGQYESEPFRIIAGETMSYFTERILQIKGPEAAIIAMGDFNDEAFNRALSDYALSVRSRNKVVYGQNPYLFNLMWPLMGKRISSYVYDGHPLMIDQFMVSKGIAKKSGRFDLDEELVNIEIYDGMVEGRYNEPVRFGQKNSNLNGYSDHLPVSFVLGEK
ncbi:MAG: endonuclease/exonuclease/phosphatase family protein [Bacteroidota bacterium]